jgi:hypothetical protein
MEQDGLAPEARQRLIDQERLRTERLKRLKTELLPAAQAKAEKLRAETEARGFANEDPEG